MINLGLLTFKVEIIRANTSHGHCEEQAADIQSLKITPSI